MRKKMSGGALFNARPFVQVARLLSVLAVAGLTSACVVPASMHVTEGISPQKIDTNVRFRTTYYFRVFDYCWSADQNGTYRKIVPETDALYRYRMTGKAPSLTNRIKFESGVLDASTIAPFGADVTYNRDINGYLVRSQDQARQQADAAALARAAEAATAVRASEAAAAVRAAEDDRNAALRRFDTLAQMLTAATSANQSDQAQLIRDAMKDVLNAFTGALRAPMSDELKTRLEAIKKVVDSIDQKGTVAGGPPPVLTPADLENARALFAKEVADQIAGLKAEIKTTPAGPDYCANDQIVKRGFHIMGPEGIRTFDQQQRLVMAMSSSAKPLIETLNEYSGRILKPQVNPAEQLLPLARETANVLAAEGAVYQEALLVAGKDASKPRVAALFDAAAKAFTPDAD